MMTGILLRHDLAIARAAMRAALVRWVDLLTVLLGVPFLLLVARAWVADLPSDRARLVGLAASFLLGFALARVTASRIAYHRSDGVLAAQALQTGKAVRYWLAVVAIGLAIGTMVLLLVGAGGPLHWLLGAAPGFLAGSLSDWLDTRRSKGTGPAWLSGFWPTSVHPLRTAMVLGLVAAGLLLALAAVLEPPVLAAATLLAGVLAAALFGSVDAERVRFMALVGHSSLATLGEHSRLLLGFFLPFALILALSFEWLVAGTGLGVGLLSLAIVAMRVLAYRAYRRQLAEWISAMLLGLVAAVAIALPFAAPFVVLAALFWLARRGRRTTWLLA